MIRPGPQKFRCVIIEGHYERKLVLGKLNRTLDRIHILATQAQVSLFITGFTNTGGDGRRIRGLMVALSWAARL